MPPAPAAAIPAPIPPSLQPATRAIGRDDLLSAARQGSPWSFLPLGLAALRAQPGDHELRFLLAAAFARLMLVTPAREHLSLLPRELMAPGSPGAALLSAIAALPDDRISIADLAATCRGNLEALAARAEPVDLHPHLSAWEAQAAAWTWLRARDGHIVRKRLRAQHGGSVLPEHDDWRLLADIKGQVTAVTLPHRAPGAPPSIKPYILEGIDPPWLVERVLRETPAAPDGYHARVTVVHEDPIELLDGLAQVDLRDVLAASRVRIITGPDAARRLAQSLERAIDTQIIGHGLSLSTVRTKIQPSVEAVMQALQRVQVTEQQRLAAEVDRLYAPRDRAWWRARFAAASPADPLRVLIPTCRYSTYIRHAAEDLAGAINRRGGPWGGGRAEVLIEPDAHSHLATPAYLRRFAEFQPDLVVMINYTRANLNGEIGATAPPATARPFPRNVPFITWIQDAMPHQLDARVGAAMGELDFIAGNVRSELFWRFGYPRGRSLDAPIVASGAKFHDGPASDEQRASLDCEIAYVSHHSETPGAMHARKCREASDNPALVAIIERLRPEIERQALQADPSGVPLSFRLREACAGALEASGGDHRDARLVEQLMQLYAMPMADRLLRHQTLEWAAEIAGRRGWRMHLYGRGWGTHPTLSPHARGELAHGDDLRAAYRCAAVHLQVSAHSIIHQRVFECALSGGLPIARLTEEDLSTLEFAAAISAARATRSSDRGPAIPDACDPWTHIGGRHRYVGFRLDRCEESRGYAELRRSLGLSADRFADGFVWLNSVHLDRLNNGADADGVPLTEPVPERTLTWLFADPASCLFTTSKQLESTLARAIDDRTWRRATTRALAERIRGRLTHEALVDRLFALVAAGLDDRPHSSTPHHA